MMKKFTLSAAAVALALASAAPAFADPKTSDGPFVSTQMQGMALRNLLANPFIVAGIVATAVAIPVAIHNSRSSGGTS